MKNITQAVNERPLSSWCTPNHEDGRLTDIYRGWAIRKWTGWKSNVGIVEPDDQFPARGCSVCGKGFVPGDMVVLHLESDAIDHINCSNDENKGKMFGQWLAYKGDYPYARMVYASVPGAEAEYSRGALFDLGLKPGQVDLTPETDPGVLEQAREDGLKRLKEVIDRIEDAVA